jgi:hypothetical protein
MYDDPPLDYLIQNPAGAGQREESVLAGLQPVCHTTNPAKNIKFFGIRNDSVPVEQIRHLEGAGSGLNGQPANLANGVPRHFQEYPELESQKTRSEKDNGRYAQQDARKRPSHVFRTRHRLLQQSDSFNMKRRAKQRRGHSIKAFQGSGVAVPACLPRVLYRFVKPGDKVLEEKGGVQTVCPLSK